VHWLGTAVAWSAILACIISAVSALLSRRDTTRARHEAQAAAVQAAYDRGRASRNDELVEIHADRDYWRDIVVRRASGEQGHRAPP
jgi:ABC-type protease/lipase transport system fused ATPase/permease subunit